MALACAGWALEVTFSAGGSGKEMELITAANRDLVVVEHALGEIHRKSSLLQNEQVTIGSSPEGRRFQLAPITASILVLPLIPNVLLARLQKIHAANKKIGNEFSLRVAHSGKLKAVSWRHSV
jgi:hypothetical protein